MVQMHPPLRQACCRRSSQGLFFEVPEASKNPLPPLCASQHLPASPLPSPPLLLLLSLVSLGARESGEAPMLSTQASHGARLRQGQQ